MLIIYRTVIHTPFAPFLVVFCNVISGSDMTDLKLLEEFTLSLESSRQASEATEKLFLVCDVFCRVAQLYVSASGVDAEDSNAAVDNTSMPFPSSQNSNASSTQQLARAELDPYLNKLGFFGASGDDSGVVVSVDGMMEGLEGFTRGGTLGEWFSGNQFISSLLEDDLSYLN